MAAFNPLAPDVQAQDFTRTSQGVGNSHVFSTLFGGLGDLAGKYADAKDEANKRKIYDEAVAGRDTAAKPLIDALAANGSTGTDYTKPGTPGATGGPSVTGPGTRGPGQAFPPVAPTVDDNGKPIKNGVGQGNISAGQGTDPVTTGAVDITKAPPEIQQAAAKRSTLDQALANGTITQAYWDLQMDTMGSNLHTKYPGYGMEIDSIVKNVVGFDPKNALVGDFFEQSRANAAKLKTTEDKWQTYITDASNRVALYRVAPDVWTNPKYDNPAERDHIYYLVAQDSARIANLDVEAKLNSNRAAQGNLTSDDMHQTALSVAATIDRQALQVGNQVYELNKKIDFWAKNPDSIDPKEVAQVLATANTIRKQNQDGFNEWWTRGITQTTDANGKVTYTGLTNGSYDKTDNAQDKGLKAATANIDAVIARLNSKDYGLAGLFGQANQMIIDQTMNKVWTTNSIALATKIMELTGGQELVKQAGVAGSKYAEGRLGLGQSILDIVAVTAGGNTPSITSKLPPGTAPPTGPKPSVTSAIKSLKDSGLTEVEQAKVIKDNLAKMVDLVQTSQNPELLGNVVNYLFGPENGEFIQINVKPEERSQVFAMLTSQTTSDAIKKASENNPELYAKYSTWVAKSFKVSFGTQAGNIQRAITDVPGANTTWDVENLRLVYHGKVQGPGDILAGGNILTNIDRMIQGDANQKAKDGVDLINAQLASIKHIAELSGINGNEMVAKTIKSLDIDFAATPNQSVLESIWTAVNPFISRVPGNPFKEQPSSQSLSVLPTDKVQNYAGNGDIPLPPKPDPVTTGSTIPAADATLTPPTPAPGTPTKVVDDKGQNMPAGPIAKEDVPKGVLSRNSILFGSQGVYVEDHTPTEARAAVDGAHPSTPAGSSKPSPNYPPPTADLTTAALGILRNEEGFAGHSGWDVDHQRLGYGSDTITRADGTVVSVKKGDTVTREDAERDLQRRLPAFIRVAQNGVGEVWGKLTPAAQAALTSLAYNYGRIPKKVAAAAQTGDLNALADAFEALPLSDGNGYDLRPRRKREAAFIRASAPDKVAGLAEDRVNAIKNGPANPPAGNPMDRNLPPTPRSGVLKPQPDSLPKTPVFGKLADATPTPEQLKQQLDAVERQIKVYTNMNKLAPADLLNERVKLKNAVKSTTKTA